MNVRIGAVVMAVLLLLYLGVVVLLAARLISVDEPAAKGLGVALVVLGLIGLWALIAEIMFGVRSQRLNTIIMAEGDVPGSTVARRPSGRPVRAEADAEFPRYREAVEANPGSWRAWFRLGLSYDASGDRRRARQSIRRAIQLSRERTAD